MRLTPKITRHLQGMPRTTSSVVDVPAGAAGTKMALKTMALYASRYKTDQRIRAIALELVGDLPDKDYLSEATLLHRFVRDQIRYVRDVRDVETVATPLETLRSGQGDCDDKSTLLACLLESIGFETRFCAVGKQPGYFVHVLTQARVNGKWLSMECTEPVSIGWHPVKYPYTLIQPIE